MKKLLKDTTLDFNLSKADLENIFSVYTDKNNNIVFNLNETLYINIDDIYSVMIIDHPIFWTTLSFKLYETTRLAWLLMKINNVSAKNIFKKIEAGTPVKYLLKQDIISIINNINE